MDDQYSMPKYCKVSFEGRAFVDTVENIQDVLPDLLSGIGPDDGYTISPVKMTDEEFDALPEFQGF